MGTSNPGTDFDMVVIKKACVNLPAAKRRAESIISRRALDKDHQVAWLLSGVKCIDLTALSGDDTKSNVQRLCYKAIHPIRKDILQAFGVNDTEITVGAVCVYPARVKDCVETYKSLGVKLPVASVATGFPSGQYPLETRIQEIKRAVEDGASEVDVVINRECALTGRWHDVYNEVCQMKKACGEAHLKAILATGELGSLTNVYRASMACMMAGADFIKTSTGKEVVNATLPVGLVMTRAIKDFYDETGIKVGFKPAGGIRSSKDVLNWEILMREQLDREWQKPFLFRIGASSVLGDIERQLYQFAYGRYPHLNELSLQ